MQYDKATRWPLPKTCEVLYLDLGSNLLRNVVGNLSLSLTSSENLREIHLSLQDNGLLKGEIHILIKSTTSMKNLERLTLHLSYNKIED